MANFLAQLKHRQVFKVATIYAVSAWPLIQIADLAVPALGLPDSVMTLLLQVFVAGFPVSLGFAWVFNFTPEGIVRASAQYQPDHTQQTNFKATLAVVGSLLLITTILLGSQLLLEDKSLSNVAADNSNSQLQSTVPRSVENKTVAVGEAIKGEKESIAILPFVAFSSDPEDEYFADGMVEELLNLLAKIPDLQVAARTSSFAYKGVTNKTIPEIGRELGVHTILEGSIRKNDTSNKIRVTAQLINVSTGEHIWSETFDREYRDIFQIQDDIANAVVNKMKLTLLDDQNKISIASETLNIDAMIEHGKGQAELSHRSVASIRKAIGHFNRAVSLDPNYARAYVGVADANILLALYGNSSRDEADQKARQAIDKALILDNELAAAYASEGLLLSMNEPLKAEQSFKRAIELNPNYAMAYLWYGSVLRNSGKLKESHELYKKAFQLDPKSPIAASNVAWGYYYTGDETKAMEIFSQVIVNDPYYPGAYILAGAILTNHGRLDQATNMYKRALDVDPINNEALKGLLTASMDVGDFDATNGWFDYIDQHKENFSEAYTNLLKSRFYLVKGEHENALVYLNKADFAHDNMGMGLFLEGEKAFYKGDYARASSIYLELQEKDQGDDGFFYMLDDGQAAVHLAYAYQQLDATDKANAILEQFEQYTLNSKDTKSTSPSYYINMAQIKALKNDQEEAFYYLQGAIDVGWVRVWEAEFNPAFALLRSETQFAQMMGGVKARLATMRNRMNDQDEFLLADKDSF
ncbi:MAG: TolB-like protein/Tfp pilus assembly protein PilF [Alphaproteobacteria bacterium]